MKIHDIVVFNLISDQLFFIIELHLGVQFDFCISKFTQFDNFYLFLYLLS